MAAVAVQHMPASAACRGERAAQATNSGTSASHAAIGQDSGGKAAATIIPDTAARENAAGVPTPAAIVDAPTLDALQIETFDGHRSRADLTTCQPPGGVARARAD